MHIPIPDISSLYGGHRFYHNWTHINDVRSITEYLLQKMDVKVLEDKLVSIGRGIAYHDVFQGKNHEAASAALCYARTTDVFASRVIMEGTTHFGTSGVSELEKLLRGDFDWNTEENDQHIFDAVHDADLWGFSEDEIRFRRNNDNITLESMTELKLHPKEIIEGRIKFFEAMKVKAEQGVFYFTEAAKDRHDIVIKNITHALNQLQ